MALIFKTELQLLFKSTRMRILITYSLRSYLKLCCILTQCVQKYCSYVIGRQLGKHLYVILLSHIVIWFPKKKLIPSSPINTSWFYNFWSAFQIITSCSALEIKVLMLQFFRLSIVLVTCLRREEWTTTFRRLHFSIFILCLEGKIKLLGVMKLSFCSLCFLAILPTALK